MSNVQHVLTGVPQGSILGPSLFITLLNDITDVVSSTKIIEYADGTVIYAASKDIEVTKLKLFEDVDAVGSWLDQNALIINLTKGKTEYLLFGSSQRLARQGDTLDIVYLQCLPKVLEHFL